MPKYTCVYVCCNLQSYFHSLDFQISFFNVQYLTPVSFSYPTTSRAWRLKGVLVYSLFASLVLSLGFIFRLVLLLVLHWNPEVYADPLPFGVSGAGAILLLELGAINVYVVFILLALSRSAQPGEGWYAPVRPAMYSPVRREEQLHLWDLSAHASPLHKIDA